MLKTHFLVAKSIDRSSIGGVLESVRRQKESCSVCVSEEFKVGVKQNQGPSSECPLARHEDGRHPGLSCLQMTL